MQLRIKSVFESINSIRHNDIVRKAIPHVYDTITEKILQQFVITSNLDVDVERKQAHAIASLPDSITHYYAYSNEDFSQYYA